MDDLELSFYQDYGSMWRRVGFILGYTYDQLDDMNAQLMNKVCHTEINAMLLRDVMRGKMRRAWVEEMIQKCGPYLFNPEYVLSCLRDVIEPEFPFDAHHLFDYEAAPFSSEHYFNKNMTWLADSRTYLVPVNVSSLYKRRCDKRVLTQ